PRWWRGSGTTHCAVSMPGSWPAGWAWTSRRYGRRSPGRHVLLVRPTTAELAGRGAPALVRGRVGRARRGGPRTGPATRTVQPPQHALEAGFDDLGADTFVVPAHRAVHDVIRAAGGLARFGELAEQLSATGAGSSAVERATATWAEQVREAADGPVSTLITELAVAPLPQDRPEELGGYARGVLIALLRMGMTRQVADVKGRLQRMDPEDPAYGEAFTELVRLEERRRLLN